MNLIDSDDINNLYLDDEEDFLIEDQDLRIIKGIISDPHIAKDFALSNNAKLLFGDAKDFAHLALDFYNKFDTLPSRRTMIESFGESDSISKVWDLLDQVDFNKSDFKFDLEKLKQKYSFHKVSSMQKAIEESDNIEETLKHIRKELDEVEKIRRNDRKIAFVQKTMRDYLPEFRNEYTEKSKNPELGRGILTRYSYLDYITNGLVPSDLLIVGAETGAGKSMLLSNMAVQIWMQDNNIEMKKTDYKKGHNIQYFSLEMPFDQCFRRAFSRIGALPTYGLRDACITKPDMLKRMSDSANFINKYPFNFEIVDIPRGVTIKNIEERYLESCSLGNAPDVVIVDYLGLMEDPDSNGDDWLRLGHIAGQLHEFARAYNVIVLSAVQLNRAKNRDPEESIGLHRIGRSSLIMHHASIGIQIETRKNEEALQDLRYHIIKNRNGEKGSHLLKKDFRTATLCDLEVYKPKHSDSSLFIAKSPLDQEDISEVLANYGWLA